MNETTSRAPATQPEIDPETVQLLTPEGEFSAHPGYPDQPDPDRLRTWYRDMVLVRRFDGEAVSLQRQGQLGLWASSLGQEAAQVGSGQALAPQDYAFPTYRDHGVVWSRGMDLVELLPMFRGTSLGGWDPNRHNVHLYTIVIGAQTLHAAGYAMGVQRDGAVGTGDPARDTAVITYFGDGAASEGDVSEAMNFASVFNVPLVFFCENNQWAISEPNERQTRVPLHRRATGFGFPGVRVDGNDVLAVNAVTRAALNRARAGEGPTLIEAFTYRMGAHTTSDDPSRYRSEAEVELWRLRDPIERVRAYLARNGHADEAFFAEVDAEAAKVGARARRECLALEPPAPETMFDHVYHEPHGTLAAERAWYAEYRKGFAAGGVR